MRKRIHGWCRVAALAGASWALAQAPAAASAAEETPLALEEAIEQALAHNRELVKGALDLQGFRLAEQQARETARAVQIVPEGAAGASGDGGDFGAGLRAEATGAYGTRAAVGAAARQIAVEGAPDVRRGEVKAEVSQPLFRRFGPLYQNEPIVSANENWQAARRAWERDRSALVVRVVELYEGLIFLHHQIACDEAFADRMEKLWLRNGRSWISSSRSLRMCWGCRWIPRSACLRPRCWIWRWRGPTRPWPWRCPNGPTMRRHCRTFRRATAGCGWRSGSCCRT